MASRYTPTQLAPFVESWKKHLADADLVVIAGRLPIETSRFLDEAGVQVVPAEFNMASAVGFRKAWLRLTLGGWLRTLGVCRSLLALGPEAAAVYASISEASFHLYSQRFFHYRRYLEHFSWKYSEVLIVDIRDTLFQASPFPCTGLHVFAENEVIGTSHFSRRWFQLSYGSATFRRLQSFPLLCAGVTLGDVHSIQQYLECNCSESLKVTPVNDVDQAVHNYMIHCGLLTATLHAFGEGPAINLNGTPLSELKIKDGRLLDAAGNAFAIVHQYDRVGGLKIAG